MTPPPPPPHSVSTRKVKHGQYDEMVRRLMFKTEKYTENSATLPALQKATGSVLKTMWSFNSSKNNIFSTSYRLWLIRREAFKRHRVPRSISINDTAIVRNFYPKNPILDANQRSFLKICRQLDGNLCMITFDYRTVLDLLSSISF